MNYFDTENNGNVNIITSKKQPGSSFKPLVYLLALSKNPLSAKTPVWDLETKFGDWEPENFDGEFLGKMTVGTALGNSRNIPAVKMFYLAGGESAIITHARALGITSLVPEQDYGAPLAIGTAELTPLELATAYSTIANTGIPHDTLAITKIIDGDGNIIEESSIQRNDYSISQGAAYLLSRILSDTNSRPAFWNTYLALTDRPVAAKTGTSNKDESSGGVKKILPRDLWTVGYTPQLTTVVWSGNTNGKPANSRGNGLEASGPIFKQFMEFAHTETEVQNFVRPSSIRSAQISSISGKLAGSSLPQSFTESAEFINVFVPKEVDNSGNETVQIDSLCN